MKIVSSMLLISLFASASFATEKFSGRCAKAAVNAAVAKWANVPYPSSTLEYMPVSASPKKNDPHTYEVVLAFSDGNDIGYGKYIVRIENLGQCKGTSAIRSM